MNRKNYFFLVLEVLVLVLQLVQSTPVQKWHKLGESQTIYIESERKFNWYKAWNECVMRNMSLITINSPEKNLQLNTLLRQLFVKPINLWLSGNDLADEGTFVWATTGKRFEFTNWYRANPDNYNNSEHCVHIYESTDFEWNDASCNHKMGFVCEENIALQALRDEWELKKQVIDRLFEL